MNLPVQQSSIPTALSAPGSAGEAEGRRAARMVTITRIGQLITSQLSLAELLPTAMQAIQELFSFADIVLMLVDPADPETLVLSARNGIFDNPSGAPIGAYRQSIHQGIVGEAARTRQPILINDVRNDPRFLACPGDEHICAELALPIVVGDRLLGVLNIEAEREIEAEDSEGLIIMAGQLGVALHNATLFSDLQRALDETRLLYATSERLGMVMDVEDVIAAYLDQVATHGPFACAIALNDLTKPGGAETHWPIHGLWQPPHGLTLTNPDRLPSPSRPLLALLDAGRSALIRDVLADPQVGATLRRALGRLGQRAVALIPLMARGRRIGCLILSTPGVHDWTEDALRLYQTTAALLAAAIDSRQGYRLLAAHGQQLAVLQERQRLAHELHDSVTQLIFSTTLIAQSVRPAWRRDPAEGERRIGRLLELSEAALTEMRALLFELRPTDTIGSSIIQVRQRGLVAALQTHLQGLETDGLPVVFDATGYSPQVIEHEEALFRIAQEGLANIVKHAQAHTVLVRLSTSQRRVRLIISDDGVGFVPAATPAQLHQEATRAGGYGLSTMRERATELGGRIRITSAPGQGTTIEVTLPLQRNRIG